MDYLGHGRWGFKRAQVTPVRGGKLKKITYRPEWDEPAPAKKKPVRKKKATTRRVTATVKPVAHPRKKKKLPPMKRGWFW
ncbi:MAG TPA: hypothetical protein VHD63_04770 [Ktedonobacteraceae bacterium]|nr:hypothetical protein [Ktedonobacteraceae bacterium]